MGFTIHPGWLQLQKQTKKVEIERGPDCLPPFVIGGKIKPWILIGCFVPKALIDQLQAKIRSYKKQIEEAEEIAALNLAKFRQVHQHSAMNGSMNKLIY